MRAVTLSYLNALRFYPFEAKKLPPCYVLFSNSVFLSRNKLD